MIYKMYDGRHIDISKIVEMGAFSDGPGNGFNFPNFSIVFQLFDQPRYWQLDYEKTNYLDTQRYQEARDQMFRCYSEVLEKWKSAAE